MPSSRSTQNYNYRVRQEAKFDRIVTVLLCVDKKKCRRYMCYIALFPSARLWNIKIYDHKRKQGQKKSLNREKHQRCSMISYVCQPPSLLQRNTNSTLHLDSLDLLRVLLLLWTISRWYWEPILPFPSLQESTIVSSSWWEWKPKFNEMGATNWRPLKTYQGFPPRYSTMYI